VRSPAIRAGAGAYALSPLVRLEIRSGRLAEAERLARGRVGVGSLAEHGAALWMLNFTLRNQGACARGRRGGRAPTAPVRDSLAGGVAYSAESYMLGASLALAGRARESAAVFDSAARGLLRAGEDPASLARVRPLALTELAWAHYLAGDTAALAPLADRIEAASAGHAWRMAQAAHHQARGLQRAARGDALGAAAEWRAAVTSVLDPPAREAPARRALTRAGRPAEAVAALRPALGGWIDAMGAVAGRRGARGAGPKAWTQVPGPAARDTRGAPHWRFVATPWQHGDPPSRRARRPRGGLALTAVNRPAPRAGSPRCRARVARTSAGGHRVGDRRTPGPSPRDDHPAISYDRAQVRHGSWNVSGLAARAQSAPPARPQPEFDDPACRRGPAPRGATRRALRRGVGRLGAVRPRRARARAFHPFVAATTRSCVRRCAGSRRPDAGSSSGGRPSGVITIMADLLGFDACGIELDPTGGHGLGRSRPATARAPASSPAAFFRRGTDGGAGDGDSRTGTIGDGPRATSSWATR
jgi:hypothetical protein